MRQLTLSLEADSMLQSEWEDWESEVLNDEDPDTAETELHFDDEDPVDIVELLTDDSDYIYYGNFGGRSNVESYKFEDIYDQPAVLVKFKDGSVYLYMGPFITVTELEYIQFLAYDGRGLNSYLTRVIGSRYAARLYRGYIVIRPELQQMQPPPLSS